MNALPAIRRQAVLPHLLGGFKHREISGILGIPEGTVRWQYRETIKDLRKKLGSPAGAQARPIFERSIYNGVDCLNKS